MVLVCISVTQLTLLAILYTIISLQLADDADQYLPLVSGEPSEHDVIVKTEGKTENVALQYSGSSLPPKEE